MKFLIAVFIGLSFSTIVYSQTQVSLDSTDHHIGDSVTVCGKVYSPRFINNAENTPTFLNLGGKYPDQKLTVVIWGDVREQFKSNPENDFLARIFV